MAIAYAVLFRAIRMPTISPVFSGSRAGPRPLLPEKAQFWQFRANYLSSCGPL